MNVGPEGEAPTSARHSPGHYDRQIDAVREIVDRIVPSNATVLVVSRGDDQLLDLGARRTLHFPQAQDGAYAGYHPADSDEAIGLLESMRSRGAEFLLLPGVAFWWLDYYEHFKQYVEHRYRLVEAGDHCWIVALTEDAGTSAGRGSASSPSTSPQTKQLADLLDNLLPEDADAAILTSSPKELSGLEAHQTWLVPTIGVDTEAGVDGLVMRLEEQGIRFLVVPKALFGWMEARPDLADHLRERHRLVTRQAHLCEIYELRHERQPVVVQRVRAATRTGKGNGSPRSFGESLKGLLFGARRNDRSS